MTAATGELSERELKELTPRDLAHMDWVAGLVNVPVADELNENTDSWALYGLSERPRNSESSDSELSPNPSVIASKLIKDAAEAELDPEKIAEVRDLAGEHAKSDNRYVALKRAFGRVLVSTTLLRRDQLDSWVAEGLAARTNRRQTQHLARISSLATQAAVVDIEHTELREKENVNHKQWIRVSRAFNQARDTLSSAVAEHRTYSEAYKWAARQQGWLKAIIG